MTVTAGMGDGGLGHSAIALVFTNSGTSPCTVTGYPGAAGLDGSGKQVTQAQRSKSGYLGGVAGKNIPVVTVKPGGTASALVEGIDVPKGTATACPTLAGLLVTPPGSHVSTRIDKAPADCDGLSIHPVVPGTTGSSR